MSDEFVHIVTVLGLIGIPSIFSMTIWCIKKCVKFGSMLTILMGAVQAQMRNELLQEYHKFQNQGWISEEDLQEWHNRYLSYHNLGQNGILDTRYEQLMTLSNNPPENKE